MKIISHLIICIITYNSIHYTLYSKEKKLDISCFYQIVLKAMLHKTKLIKIVKTQMLIRIFIQF